MHEPRVRVGAHGVTRRFGPIVANDRVDLAVAPGTIHAVVGENGAGKTTLMRILYGLDRPDEGSVVIDDEPASLSGPAEALARGIGMVHQEFKLVPELTLLENLVLGAEPTRGPLLDWDTARAQAERLVAQTRIDLDWDLPVERAPVNVRQRLEIMRLLYRGADVLILDEPTAVLAPAQVGELFALLRQLREQGQTVVFISHKLGEVLEIADVITVLRNGQAVATVTPEETDASRLAELMVGEHVETPASAPTAAASDVLLQVEDLSAVDDGGIQRLLGVSLTVSSGEIVGVAGVAGNGQDELVECVAGLRSPTAGRILLADQDITHATVGARRRRGLAYVSADRAEEGLAVTASVADNAIAGAHRDSQLAPGGWLRSRAVARFVHSVLARFGVHYSSAKAPVASLSGGNQQRLVLGRELAAEPRLLLAAQPTRGVDVKGIAFVHEQLLSLRARGAGVLLISEELDELLDLSDRVVVLYRGSVAGAVEGRRERRSELGRLMLGEMAAA